MGRTDRRTYLRACVESETKPVRSGPLSLFLTSAERRILLAGTALVTTLMIAAPTPASAQQAVFIPASPFPVNITNNANCVFPGTCALINTILPFGSINFTNNGDFAVAGGLGIVANTIGPFSPITIVNTGDIATVGGGAIGITTSTTSRNSAINITNSGDIATFGIGAIGINAITFGRNSGIDITNTGNIATAAVGAIGINASTVSQNSSATIVNNGSIVTTGQAAYGIYGFTSGNNSNLSVTNNGDLNTSARFADGIYGFTVGNNADISIANDGDIITSGQFAEGVFLNTNGPASSITVTNNGTIDTRGQFAEGIDAVTFGANSDILIVNNGDIDTRGFSSAGIYAAAFGGNSSLTIQNSGSIGADGPIGYGVYAVTTGAAAALRIENAGDISGSTTGVYTYSNTSTTIINSGSISAGSNLAIDTEGASTTIQNTGLITGFVNLTDSADVFNNMAGGEFSAIDTSDFGGGSDLFENNAGSTLRTARARLDNEFTNFVGLERFENRGLITMQDGRQGDVFQISNTLGGTDHNFVGGTGSTLAVDTFLGGPGSTSDRLIIEGNVTGRTLLTVANVNPGSAQLNEVGIPVIEVEGAVKSNAFYLDKPIDAGFFDYDLVFRPTGSGVFELKSHTGGGAHLLPELVTVVHDTFHNSTETWFDQSTDLRVLLAQGAACNDANHPQENIRCQQLNSFTPGVWARGSGSWLKLEDDAKTRANGKTYNHNLDRDLDIWVFESGIDFGKRDLISDGDILVFGVLGGAVEAVLDYKALARTFNVSGGEVGAYATYLKGGLFVDTLFKTIFGQLDPKDVRGFPNKLDSTTFGLRTDAGYRFGGMRHGPFVEPLATVAVSWSDIEDFTTTGNAVDFDNDENVRGRLGVRLGTSTDVWDGTTMEPFIVGSLWGNLSGNHHATLTSGGETFKFTDKPQELWGVVSAGVNFFNPSAQTAVFAKVDYTFADQTQGVGVKAGMRYNW